MLSWKRTRRGRLLSLCGRWIIHPPGVADAIMIYPPCYYLVERTTGGRRRCRSEAVAIRAAEKAAVTIGPR